MSIFDRIAAIFDVAKRGERTIGPVNKPAGVPPQPLSLPEPQRGAVARVPLTVRTGGSPSSVPGGEQFSDDPFMGPAEPIAPKDGSAPPRRMQFQPGYNLVYTPRSTEAISFAQLRNLSEYSLVRIAIEHVKEALKSHEWDITTDDDFDPQNYQADIRSVKCFLEKPDRNLSWDEWMGELIEDVLSIDALSIYRHRTYAGELHALEIVDGATIKVLCDTRGRSPAPPAPAYQQILYGVPKAWYTKDELIYAPRNRRAHKFYGLSPVEQIILKVNEGIRRDFYNLAQFTDGNTPAGIATVPKEWSMEQIRQFDEYFNSILAGNFQRRSKLFFGPEGLKIEKFHDDEVFGLFNKYDEWLARIICFAFGISPVPFVAMTNRAVAQELGDVEAEGGVASLKMFIERLMNTVIDQDFRLPHLRFNWVTDRARLQEKRVKKNTEYVKNAIFTVNEVRLEEGKDEIPEGDVLYFNGQPLGQVTAPAGGADSAPAAPVGPPGADDKPARPVLPDGSRPVLNAAGAALQKCMVEEYGKWERFALKRMEEGKLAEAFGFDAEFLPATEVAAVCKGLAKARTKDQVKHLFDTRRAGVKALRIEPPSAGEMAGHAGPLREALRGILGERAREVAGAEKGGNPAPVSESVPVKKASTLEKVAGPLVARDLSRLLRSRRGG